MLNKKSNELILFFIKNKCLHENREKINMFTKKLLLYLFQELIQAEKYVKSLTFFPIVEKITKMNIPGNLHHVPHHIIRHIHNKSLYNQAFQKTQKLPLVFDYYKILTKKMNFSYQNVSTS